MLLNCVFGETLENPLDYKEIQPVHPKGDQSWVFIGRTDVEAETPILWPPEAKSWLIWKDPDAGKDWGQEEKGTTEDEMVGWHHRLDGHEFGWTPGVGDGQGSLACCSSWGRKESDTTERLNRTEKYYYLGFPDGSVVKNTNSAGMQVWSLCWEDPLEKEIATHSSVLAWEIPWTKQPGGLQSMGLHTTEQLNNNNVMYCIVCIFSIYTVC